MRQARITGPRNVVLVDAEDPVLGPGDVLIRVKAVGLCTLEQRVFRGTRTEYPFLGGHEVGGTVVQSPSLRLQEGATVAVSTFPRCGTCIMCRTGMDNLCGYQNRRARDKAEPWGPGGLADYVTARDQCVFPVTGTAVAASLVEPLACVLHSLSQAHLDPTDYVAVFGLGVMGALHVLAATQLGLSPVWIGLDDAASPTRRLATSAIELPNVSAADLPKALRSEQISPKAAFCIRGGVDALRAAFSIVAPGGTVVNFASPSDESVFSLELRTLRANETCLRASVNHTLSDFAAAAAMSNKMAEELDSLVAERFPLSSINEALSRAVDTDIGRIIVEP